MPDVIVTIVTVASAFVVIGFVSLLRSLSRTDGTMPAALVAGRFSATRYAPMASLLDAGEYEYLRMQPGFTPAVGRRFRAERRAIFRQYLQMLKNDFGALYQEASLLLLHSRQDRPELARALFEQRLRFAYTLSMIECRLILHRMGADLQAGNLVQPVVELQRQFESAILSSAAA